MSLVSAGVIGEIEERVNVFEVTVHITMKYALVDGRIDTTVLKGTVIAVEFDSVGVLVTIDLIDIDSHSSFIPPSSVFSCV